MTRHLSGWILKLIPSANNPKSKDHALIVWITWIIEVTLYIVGFPLLFRWLGLRMEHLIISSNFIIQLIQLMGHNIHSILTTSPTWSVVGGLLIGVGLLLWVWATYCQWAIGRGTPVLVTPTAHLVVKGPYRFTRNPIQLGTMLVYAGLGLLQDSYCIALISLVGYGSVGSWYNMKLEEKELLVRFGEEYLQYKEEVPFLIPRFFRWNSLKSWMKKRNKDKG